MLDAFCARLHDEGVSVETAVDVVSTTQPIVTPDTVNALAEAAFSNQRYDPVVLADAANSDAAPLPVRVPQGACSWRAVDETTARSVDVMTIELSSPFKNPFGRNSFGLVARVSLARESATWYWVPLGQREGRWAAGRPMLLAMR